jgi:hypothetical protein
MTNRPIRLHVIVTSTLLFTLAGVVSAVAQGSDEERRACTPDVMRLCREYIPSVDRIVACLNARRDELSPACQLVMVPERAAPQSTASTRRPAARPTAHAKTRPAVHAKTRTVAAKPARSANTATSPRPMNLLPTTAKPSVKKKAAPQTRAKQAQRATP